MDQIEKKFPHLKFLSLLGNVACPDQLSNNDKDEDDYRRYRHYVLYRLPNLKFLDSTKIKSEEKREAIQRGLFLKVIRPNRELVKNNTFR